MSEAAAKALRKASKLLVDEEHPLALVEWARQIDRLTCDDLNDDDLYGLIKAATAGDSFITNLGSALVRWDSLAQAPWAEGTARNSQERRNKTYLKLEVSEEVQRLLDLLRPVSSGITAITKGDFTRWYTRERAIQHEFYWPRYATYLQDVKQWTAGTISDLDLSTDEIVERLGDPIAKTTHPQRGLVVGYVQSGKTANMTGVIAKAIDAGYRLVIVLTGMHEALRKQTQRRLDMELLGKANILGGSREFEVDGLPPGDYLNDSAWERELFNTLQGQDPSPAIIRLTSLNHDFKQGLMHSLHMRTENMPGTLWPADELFPVPARIAVVKKNKDVLGHLLAALKHNKASVSGIPALIIDDESDQASVNTVKPADRDPESPRDIHRRKAINGAISEILRVLKRGQYVGYTATPFANVFSDPTDLEDIFPRDFIISLPEPSGYMGASSFFDSVQPEFPKYALSNREAYVRDLKASDNDRSEQDNELLGAIATFVVTGAIKLLRANLDPTLAEKFSHHTMLVHESAGQGSHKALRDRIVRLWKQAAWGSVEGRLQLVDAFDDLLPTLEDRRDASAPFIGAFSEIEEFIPEVIRRLETESGGVLRSPEKTVTIVNSDRAVATKLDFDHHATWKIIVGGAMLSRGFTIEGLTVSYFRRSPKAQDTLLQMGRWFGYRPGYRDLVRIYLATNTAISKSQFVNLYDAFDEVADVEATFREQLSIYSTWEDDRPGITPEEIFPLVEQSLPWLRPTARNKMYNARIATQLDKNGIFSPKAPAWENGTLAKNWRVSSKLVGRATNFLKLGEANPELKGCPAYCGVVDVDTVISVLTETKYLNNYLDSDVRPRVAAYQKAAEDGVLKDFLVVFPQLVEKDSDRRTLLIPGLTDGRTVVRRKRNVGTALKAHYYGEFTDENHRQVALSLVRNSPGLQFPELDVFGDRTHRGVILAYIIRERGVSETGEPLSPQAAVSELNPEDCTVGLTLYLPGSVVATQKRLTFVTSGK